MNSTVMALDNMDNDVKCYFDPEHDGDLWMIILQISGGRV